MTVASGHGFEVGACAETVAIAGQHRNRCRGIAIKIFEGSVERLGGHAVHRIASLRTLQGNDRDSPFFVNLNRGVRWPVHLFLRATQ